MGYKLYNFFMKYKGGKKMKAIIICIVVFFLGQVRYGYALDLDVACLATASNSQPVTHELQWRKFQEQIEKYDRHAQVSYDDFSLYLLRDKDTSAVYLATFDKVTGKNFVNQNFLAQLHYLKKYQQIFPPLTQSLYKTPEWRILFDDEAVRSFLAEQLTVFVKNYVSKPVDLISEQEWLDTLALIKELDSNKQVGQLQSLLFEKYDYVRLTQDSLRQVKSIRDAASKQLDLSPKAILQKILQKKLDVSNVDNVTADQILTSVEIDELLALPVFPNQPLLDTSDQEEAFRFALTLYNKIFSYNDYSNLLEPEKLVLSLLANEGKLGLEQINPPPMVEESTARGFSLLPVNMAASVSVNDQQLAELYKMLDKAKYKARPLIYTYEVQGESKQKKFADVIDHYRIEVVDNIKDAVIVDYFDRVIKINKNVLKAGIDIDQVILFLTLHWGLKVIRYEVGEARGAEDDEAFQINEYIILLRKELELFKEFRGDLDKLIAQFTGLKNNNFFIAELEGKNTVTYKGERFALTFPDLLETYRDKRTDVFDCVAAAYARLAWLA